MKNMQIYSNAYLNNSLLCKFIRIHTWLIHHSFQHTKLQLDESQNNFSVTSLDVVVDDLMNFTDSVEEIVGGDMAFLVETMQEMVDQVDVHMHDISVEEMSYLSHRVKGASF